MQTESVQAFIAVCDLGSFQAAADALYLTQPAVSKRVSNLEDRLGHTLFDRVGRGATLTEAGRAYLPHARELVAVVADGNRALDSLGNRVAGPLTLALSHHVSLHRMPSVLRAYIKHYPDVHPEINFADSEAACECVVKGECELAVITLPTTPHPILIEKTVWDDPMQVFVSDEHALAGTPPATLADLAQHPAVLPPTASYTRAIIDRTLSAHDVALEARMESHYLETLRMLAGIGLGWTVLPSAMSHRDLIGLSFDGVEMTRRLGVVYHPRRRLSNAALALLALLGDVPKPPGAY
ncbi:LysR family transcriptional regulator [Salinisphaera sp. USBA-960]|nr:LysR family transcriptional regulator [Salifodinibacter halophilus]NNC26097.1 LysR family transcriptional regulator [Salifodinibacter halophilus]